MPYKSNADKAAWARRKYHGDEEFRKAEIEAVCARRNKRIAREVAAMPKSPNPTEKQKRLIHRAIVVNDQKKYGIERVAYA